MHIIIYYFLGKKKAAVYEKINGRSFKFETEAQIDTYIRTINQCNFKITNNNPVKCSIIDCNQTHKHKMKKVYLACNCKKASCNLKYRYQCCEYGGDWELYTIGNHPHLKDHVKEEYMV